jgi:hypothetical protein
MVVYKFNRIQTSPLNSISNNPISHTIAATNLKQQHFKCTVFETRRLATDAIATCFDQRGTNADQPIRHLDLVKCLTCCCCFLAGETWTKKDIA